MDTKKRPANPLPRGHSPPEKRSRPLPQSDRPGISRRATDPRPQLGLSRLTTDHPGSRSPFHSGSASNHGSGASTPTQLAPTAPSMLPANFQESRVSEHNNDAAVPASLASLRLLRKKKQAMAKALPSQTVESPPPVVTAALQAQLKASQMEIAALRRQMKAFDDLPKQVAELKAELGKKDTPVDEPGSMQAILRRLESLEKSNSAPNTTNPTVTAQAVKPLQSDSLERLTSSISTYQKQLGEIKVWMGKRDLVLDSIPNLKKDIESAKSQANNISGLQVESLVDNARKRLQVEAREMSADLTKAIEENYKAVQNLIPNINACVDFKHDLEQHHLPLQLRTLEKRITETEKDHAKLKDLQHELSKLGLTINKQSNDIDRDFRHLIKQQDEAKEVVTKIEWQMADFTYKMKDYPQNVGQIASLQRGQVGHANQLKSLHQMQATQIHEQRRLAAQQEKADNALNHLCKAHDNLYEERLKLENHLSKVRDDRLDKLENELKSVRQMLEQTSESSSISELGGRLLELEKAATAVPQARLDQGQQHAENLRNVEFRLQTEIRRSQDKISEMELMLSKTSTASVDDKPGMSRTEFEAMQNHLQQLETAQTSFKGELQNVQSDIDSVLDAMPSLENDIHKHGGAIDVLEKDIPSIISSLLKDRLDFIQSKMNESSSLHTARLSGLETTSKTFEDSILQLQNTITAETNQRQEDVSRLQLQIHQDQKPSLSSDFTSEQSMTLQALVQDTASMRQDIQWLQTFSTSEKARQDNEIGGVKELLSAKQDMTTAERATDAIRLAVRNLQDQYNNITTDDLHQRMATWFLAQYPSDAADFLRRTSAIEFEIHQLKNHWTQLSRIQPHTGTLLALAQNGPPTNSSVSNSDIQKLSTKTEEALQEARTARQGTDAANKRVAEFEEGIRTLSTQLSGLANEERNARAEFVTKAGTEHQQRTAAEARIWTHMYQLKEELKVKMEEAVKSVDSTIARVESVDRAIKDVQAETKQLEDDLGTVNSVYIQPNQDLLDQLRNLFVAVMQSQRVIEDINEKLPRDRLRIKWVSDLNATEPPSDAQDSGKGKGKERQ